VKRGDIIVFRYPMDIPPKLRETRDGRSRRSHKMVNKRVYMNGQPLDEPYAITSPTSPAVSRQLPDREPAGIPMATARQMLPSTW
jgi:hypothetical protein